MIFGEIGISTGEFAQKFVSQLQSNVQNTMGSNTKPPCSGGNKTMWTSAVTQVLAGLGSSLGYEAYPWMLDLIWWSNKQQRMVLAVESEFNNSLRAIEDDFQKLTVFKCPLKLLVFSADAQQMKSRAETYLQLLTQHVKDEEYLLVGFTVSGPRCFVFKVPHDGKLERVEFQEMKLSKAAGNT